MGVTVRLADLADPAVGALLAAHAAYCTESSPPESRHFLPAAALDVPEVTLWAAWRGDAIAGVGALKELSAEAGEIKSMHTAAESRGMGVARAILAAILGEAARRGYRSLWLETGATPEFAAARALYAASGFLPCGPFGAYRPDPNSAFFTRRLKTPEAVQ